MLKVKVRVSKRRGTIYIPADISKALGISEGDYLVKVEGGRVVMEPAVDPFEYALKVKKFAKTTFEAFEKESEEMQNEQWAKDTA
ncbi:AbrB/MazE/SpoVT family DNA-binding domain-containing protein [Pyrobaculum aerophilum]|uniref:AbrB family transcriptional regulator n=1 Tax=Pyrobaculum aerophilum TaxID=13773 RepID=A0A371QXL9_9CREN|nr:AbrB/MazE/SpoVT family DNA-binding domain-containing protein [Pyrobaculum aerophilum]RFA95079.1 AbrB family transcriptional regulator [Pyrobaculum aerophilum]RFA97314.1 AbrB family transcriptional regulator [Pyrobaculum aerophilum]